MSPRSTSNNDGCLDIFVANDAMENYYFENDGKGRFAERALDYGIAYGEHGQGVSSMGPVFGDVNRDGLLDIFIPNLNYCSLLIQGKRGFQNVTDADRRVADDGPVCRLGRGPVRLRQRRLARTSSPSTATRTTSTCRRTRWCATRATARSRTSPSASGPYFQEKYVGRGAAWADIDNDGDIDSWSST